MINWNEIKTVLLDMDGTILDLHFDNHFWLEHLPQRYAEINRITLSEANNYLVPRFAAEHGTLNWYCIDYWSDELNLDIEALKVETQERIQFLPGAEAFLTHLQANDIQAYLVTNAHRKSLNLKSQITNLENHFEQMISSHDFGHAKEHLSFWHALQQQIQFDPEQTLFIDDTESILNTAQTFGIKYCFTLDQPDSQKPTRRELRYPSITHYQEMIGRAILDPDN